MDPFTEIGGSQLGFPHTTAGFEAMLRNPDPHVREVVLRTLATRYWKPVYLFLRRAYSKSNEDAKDLAQAFFLWLLERDLLPRFDPRSSSFRTFLKGVLRNFAGNEHQALQRLKRGGGLKIVPLDAVDAPSDADPEKAFDQAWMNEIVARSVRRVRERYARGPRADVFRAFEQHDLAGGDPPSYAELAKALGAKESDIRNWLFEVREQVRAEVRAELAESASDLDGEWRDFLSS